MSTQDTLIVRLIEERGLSVPQARAAARLLEGFDTDTDLSAAIAAAEATYGSAAFASSTPAPTRVDLYHGARPAPQTDPLDVSAYMAATGLARRTGNREQGSGTYVQIDRR